MGKPNPERAALALTRLPEAAPPDKFPAYSVAMRSQVISRCSPLSPMRRGGGMRTMRVPSKRTPHLIAADGPVPKAASTRVTSFSPS
jgi:hypothetical protein